MARKRLLGKGTQCYRGYRVNSAYVLNEDWLSGLIDVTNEAIDSHGTALAVRLDFSLKKGVQDQDIGRCNPDMNRCFQDFLDRLKHVVFDIDLYWKLEFSEAKGFHIHSVFLFDAIDVKTFTTRNKLFEDLKRRWALQTDGNGTINICKSSEALSDDDFGVDSVHSYTLLGDLTNVEKNRSYHLQKNKFDKKAGFIHWISYLAKTEQSIGKGKAAGKRQYRGE